MTVRRSCLTSARVLAWAIALVAVVWGFAAELPPAIQADRYLIQAERQWESGDYNAASATLDKILALQASEDMEIPTRFWFKYAQVAAEAKNHSQAIASIVRYLRVAGKRGQHYEEALRLLDRLEQEQVAEEQRKKAEARRRRAELTQAEAEARRSAARALAAQEERERVIQIVEEELSFAAEPFRDELKSGGQAPELVRIAGGSTNWPIGSDCQGECGVSVAAFAISKFEITRGEFARFVKATRYRTDAESKPRFGCDGLDQSWARRTSGHSWRRPAHLDQTDQHPVVCVSARDAEEYGKWLSSETGKVYRLPYEMEWIYAYYAGSPYWGAKSKQPPFPRSGCQDGKPVTHRGECRHHLRTTTPVGSFDPNAVGIYDMFGNVSEITSTCRRAGRTAGAGARNFGVILSPYMSYQDVPDCSIVYAMGGSFNNESWFDAWFGLQNYRFQCRSTDSDVCFERNNRVDVGFRLVRELP